MALAIVGTPATGISSLNSAAEPVNSTTTPLNAVTVTAGSLLVVGFGAGDDNNARTVTCTDGNSPPNFNAAGTVLHASLDNQLMCAFYKANANAGSTTVTLTESATNPFRRGAMLEISGADPVTPVNTGTLVSTQAGTTATGAGAVTLTAITPTAIGNWIVSIWEEIATGVFSAPAGWTLDAQVHPTSGGEAAQLVILHQQAASLAAITPAVTCSLAGDRFHGIAFEVVAGAITAGPVKKFAALPIMSNGRI